MAIPVLAAKFYIPPPLTKVVARPRLIERLNEGLTTRHKLTLISAPAGFGKSTLVSEWIAASEQPAAWLSLDANDNDLARFLVYLIHALQKISPTLGSGLLDVLETSGLSSVESILTALLDEISVNLGDFILVLDDYHEIDARSVDEALTFLIEHLPPQMHLVITTREDPGLPIPRLRVRDQLTELRAADLRFTPSEAAAFFNQVMGLNLVADEVAALETRTEGWIAGLKLAALSMQGLEDVTGFIQEFAGDHRYIMDYLVEEVLRRQPEPMRGFLLQTSILDRLSGPLCEAVTGQPGGTDRLETLLRGNFFLIPLDDRRQWYRYHHLFAEVLRAYLAAEQPDQVCALHRRASAWFEQNGAIENAIHHSLAAADYARAAGLVERAFPAYSRSRQEVALLAWLRALPENLLRQRPVLCNLFAGALLQTGVLDDVEAWLQAAERWLEPATAGNEQAGDASTEMVVLNEEEFRRLPAAVALHRAGQALMLGKVAETVRHARRALDLALEDDDLRRGGAAVLLGLTSWTSGDLEAAKAMYAKGMVGLRRSGHLSDYMGCALALADIQLAQGLLRDAMRTYDHALQLAVDEGMPALRGTADMLVGKAELFREQNDLQAAAQFLAKSKEQGEHTGLPQSRYRWRVAMALIRVAEGNLDRALLLLDEAERLYMGDFSPNVRPIAAMKARLWAAQGRVMEALDWARERNLSAEDDLSYLREYEHITLVRVLLACYRRDHEERVIQEAAGLLERLLMAAENGGRVRSAIEIRILQALIFQAEGKIQAALAPLQEGLAMAEPEGYVRLFADEGPPMKGLLREALACKISPAYTHKLLAAFEAEQHRLGGDEFSRPTAPVPQALAQAGDQTTGSGLVEPLSQRELEVLRLFRTELSGPEIARELVVALSTVRTHTKSIYSKLAVNSRRAAVRRAIELKLI